MYLKIIYRSENKESKSSAVEFLVSLPTSPRSRTTETVVIRHSACLLVIKKTLMLCANGWPSPLTKKPIASSNSHKEELQWYSPRVHIELRFGWRKSVRPPASLHRRWSDRIATRTPLDAPTTCCSASTFASSNPANKNQIWYSLLKKQTLVDERVLAHSEWW